MTPKLALVALLVIAALPALLVAEAQGQLAALPAATFASDHSHILWNTGCWLFGLTLIALGGPREARSGAASASLRVAAQAHVHAVSKRATA